MMIGIMMSVLILSHIQNFRFGFISDGEWVILDDVSRTSGTTERAAE